MGEITKERWVGQFQVKAVLAHSDRFQLERLYNQLIPKDGEVAEDIKLRAATIAELSVRIVKGPRWWDETASGQLMVDMDPLYDLLVLCNKESKNWSEELDKAATMEPSNVVGKGST
jgi:hypothetical protein